MTHVDYLIVGQGVAGINLSYTLLRNNKKFVVVDQGYTRSASYVAEGVFNPVTGKNFVKTWKADHLFPFLWTHYSGLEELLGINCIKSKKLTRIINHIHQQNEWLPKCEDENYKLYICENENLKNYHTQLYGTLGGIDVNYAGYVNLPLLLSHYRTFLESKERLIQKPFLFEDLKIESNKVIWQNYTAKKIIFCEGAAGVNNPFFKHLPFKLVKGENMEVSIKNLEIDQILSRGLSVVPLGENRFNVGSTYAWEYVDTCTTQEALDELIRKTTKIVCLPFQVLQQRAGIRPASKDRRPFIGMHHQFESVGIFNGFGSKGVSLSPYFAQHFFEFLEKGSKLNEEVDINRYI